MFHQIKVRVMKQYRAAAKLTVFAAALHYNPNLLMHTHVHQKIDTNIIAKRLYW